MVEIDNKDRIRYKELKYAITNRKIDTAKTLIISNPALLDEIDVNGISLLQMAIFSSLEIVKTLISQKININYRNNHGFTALTNALVDGNYEAVKLLLQAGAVLDENHPKDRSAKEYALSEKPALAELLAKAERHELEPLTSPLLNQTSSSEKEKLLTSITNKVSLPPPTLPDIASTTQKQQPITTSWYDNFTTLRRRYIPEVKKIAPAVVTIEMTTQKVTPPAAPTNHFHIE